jgi:hypothetical protein
MKYVVILAAIVALRLLLYPVLKRLFAVIFAGSAVKSTLRDVGRTALAKQPDRIVLVPRNLRATKVDPAVTKLADPLFTRGFQEAGLFEIRELPGVYVRFLVKPSEGVIAAICTHARGGVWLDCITYYADGKSATFSSNPPHGLDPRPGHVVTHLPGAPALDLYERFVRERPKGVFRTAMPDDVPAQFERAWAEGIAWRKQKGISAGEVAQVAQRRAA